MSLTSLLQGVDIYTLPDSLSRFIQEKTASGFGKLRLVPFAFPVFIMNPYKYSDNFKDTLRDFKSTTGQSLLSDTVPPGEIWDIRNIDARGSGIASTVTLYVRNAEAFDYSLKRELNATKITYEGNFPLEEGERIRVTFPTGTLFMYIIGVKKYA